MPILDPVKRKEYFKKKYQEKKEYYSKYYTKSSPHLNKEQAEIVKQRCEYKKEYRKKLRDKYPGTTGVIYVITIVGTNYYKIGKTKIISTRVSCLRGAIPFDIKVIKTYDVHDIHSIEKVLHEHFKDRHHRYEWFLIKAFNIEEITTIINKENKQS